ncbi:hypothetical protein DV736_g1953, partial [Chaetothyriales sp. CBS 134916]
MFPTFVISLCLVSSAFAAVHHLFVGTFANSILYTLAFDDEASTLKLVRNNSASTSHSWIAFDHNKKNVYGVAGSAVSSYSVENNGTSLRFDTSIETGGNCSSVHNIFVVAAPKPPYTVYATPFGEDAQCGTVLDVYSNGTLSEVVQNYTYLTTSGVHGLAFSRNQSYLYSADDSANSLWTHSIDPTTGELTYVSRIAGAESGADPRHATLSPSGKYLYVIYEGTNELAVYALDSDTGIPTFTNVTYPLIPQDSSLSNSSYWSDEVALSASKKYLWATSRARSSNNTGYISAFSLESSGAIKKQLFLVPTTASGGAANSVAPSFFSDQWVALTDNSVGFVQIWKLAANGTSAEVAATLNLNDGGCYLEAFSDLEVSGDRDRIASLVKLRWPHAAPGSGFVVSFSESIEEHYYQLTIHMVKIRKGANVLIARKFASPMEIYSEARIKDGVASKRDKSLPSPQGPGFNPLTWNL